VLDAIKQAGTGYKLLRMVESFNATLSEEQKQMIIQMKATAGGMAAQVLPEDTRPILDYVLADDGEPVVIKAIGAYFHPAVKQTLGTLAASHAPVVEETTAPITIKCRECGHVGQYGLED
jgi:uncharacterized Fe-S center protein